MSDAVVSAEAKRQNKNELNTGSWSAIDRLYVEYCWLKGEGANEIAPKVDRTPHAVAGCINIIKWSRTPYLPTKKVA